MLSPSSQALDLTQDVSWGRLIRSPLQLGFWALLEPMGAQNHAPQLCWINPDLLACVWMAGVGEGTAGMSVFMSLLAAGDESWSEPQIISRDNQRSEQNPLLFVSDDHLHLIHSAQSVRDLSESSLEEYGSTFSMQWTAKLRHQALSYSQLKPSDFTTWGRGSWTIATDLIPDPAFCRHPPTRTVDGNYLLPLYHSLEHGGAFGHDYSFVLPLSCDASPLSESVIVPGSTGRVHGSIVSSADGSSLLQFFRSRLADCVYRSVSTDDGLSWSQPVAISLPNNNSSLQALRLQSGRLAIVFNRFGFVRDSLLGQDWGDANWPRTRWPLSVALSEDDGDSWPWIRDLDTGFGFQGAANWTSNGQLAYPSILEGNPGELHVAYSWSGRAAIRYLFFYETDILGVSSGLV